jgi:hypothetical protein
MVTSGALPRRDSISGATLNALLQTLSLLQVPAFMEGNEPQSGSSRDPPPDGRVGKAYAIEVDTLTAAYQVPQRRVGVLEPATGRAGIEAASGPEDARCKIF